MVAYAPAPRRRVRIGRFIAPVLLAAVTAAVVLVILNPAPATVGHRPTARRTARPRVPPYWLVRPGDTYAEISAKTGVTTSELEAFNPSVDPLNLAPGQRLNLWRYPPRPRPPPPGPMFWTVRAGQSFGSIAAKTGINIVTLEQLNPLLKPTTLQPGDRVRLRH
jgi:LysM repeat protein